MPSIIYDVAVSLDGFISGPRGDISKFAHDGPVVEDYAARLAGYDTAIMGRATYEFGYAFGLEPGDNPYPHMKTFVFSDNLDLPGDAVSVLPGDLIPHLRRLRNEARGDIYLCGGGAFAGACLAAGQVDRVILKRAPVLLGGGVPLFAGAAADLTHCATKTYDSGYVLQTFDVGR